MNAVREGRVSTGGARIGSLVARTPRRTRWDPGGLELVELVARLRGVPALLLLHPSRCTAAVAEARQLAMYLMHVVLRRTYAEVGKFFGRDRTTVSHACAHIEDCRDAPTFDSEVMALEAVLSREPVPEQEPVTERSRAAHETC